MGVYYNSFPSLIVSLHSYSPYMLYLNSYLFKKRYLSPWTNRDSYLWKSPQLLASINDFTFNNIVSKQTSSLKKNIRISFKFNHIPF